jgi:hypothetical protein
VQVVNPATEQTIAELDTADVDETDAAVSRAKAAFPAWHRVGPNDHARLLRSWPRSSRSTPRSSRASVNAATFVVDGGISAAYVTPEESG